MRASFKQKRFKLKLEYKVLGPVVRRWINRYPVDKFYPKQSLDSVIQRIKMHYSLVIWISI